MKWRDERGVVTAMFAVLAIFFFLIIGVVFEGGRKLENIGRAQDVASEAARAAAASLDVESIAMGDVELDLSEAESQARGIVSAAGPRIEFIEMVSAGETVTVTVRVSGDSWLPGFSLDSVGRHTAQIIDPADFTP